MRLPPGVAPRARRSAIGKERGKGTPELPARSSVVAAQTPNSHLPRASAYVAAKLKTLSPEDNRAGVHSE
jgi:hypothetical protein